MKKEVFKRYCTTCGKDFQTLNKDCSAYCMKCLVNQIKINAYNPDDFDYLTQELLKEYRNDWKVTIRCRRCHKNFVTTKRGLHNYGFDCDNCRLIKSGFKFNPKKNALKQITDKLKAQQQQAQLKAQEEIQRIMSGEIK